MRWIILLASFWTNAPATAQVLAPLLANNVPATSIGVWTNKGTAIGSISAKQTLQPNVIYEGSAKILSGTVFKMWYANGPTNGTANVNYAESTNGLSWTQYSSNPVLSGIAFEKVFKSGSTYYLYGSPSSYPTTSINSYTSTDGLTWTLAVSGALAVGSGGSWDSAVIAQLSVTTVDAGGTWWAYYAGTNINSVATKWSMGLATSTDGTHWTKGGSNPLMTAGGPSNCTFGTVGSEYYCWTQITLPGFPGATNQIPSDITRFSASNPGGPWQSITAPTYYRTLAGEGVDSANGQVADPCIVAAFGNVYMWYSAAANSSNNSAVINLAEATGTTLAQLVGTREGIVNVPVPSTNGFALNMIQTASDNFTRSNANPIGGNWTQFFTGSSWAADQIVSNQVQGSVVGKNDDSVWNARTFPAAQWASIKIGSIASTASYAGVSLRASTNGTTGNEYRVLWNGNTSTGVGTWLVDKVTSGVTFTNLITGAALTVHAGDVLTGTIVGTNICTYVNTYLSFCVTDSTFASGGIGISLIPATSTANSVIASWAAGMIVGTRQ